MHYKIIIQGNLVFGKPRSFDQVVKMYEHRLEIYYKSGLLFSDEHLDASRYLLDIPRTVVQGTDKQYKNTVDLLRYLSQFAISGKVGAWIIDEGKLLDSEIIEPYNDKAAVQAFLKGKELAGQKGKEEEAIESLSMAINKHNAHSQAYERRGYVNLMLKSYEDALYDFTKAIKLDKENSDAFLGRAKLLIFQGETSKAIEDLDNAIKTSLALQPTYWKARRIKAECHIKLGEWEKAEFDLKLFTRRKFLPNDPNYLWKKWALYQYGNVLLKLDKYEEALIAHSSALEIEDGHGKVSKAEQLTRRGIAIKKSGGSGYLSDWKEAATLGYKEAKKLLEEHVN